MLDMSTSTEHAVAAPRMIEFDASAEDTAAANAEASGAAESSAGMRTLDAAGTGHGRATGEVDEATVDGGKEQAVARVAPLVNAEEDTRAEEEAGNRGDMVARALSETQAKEEVLARRGEEQIAKEEVNARAGPEAEVKEEVVGRAAPEEEEAIVRAAPEEEKVVARAVPEEEKAVAHTASEQVKEGIAARAAPAEEVIARAAPEEKVQEEILARVALEEDVKDEVVARAAPEEKVEEEIVARASPEEDAKDEVVAHAAPEEMKDEMVARASPEEEVVARAAPEEKVKEEMISRASPEEGGKDEIAARMAPEEMKEEIAAPAATEEKVIARAAPEEKVKEEMVVRVAPEEVVTRAAPEEETVARAEAEEKGKEEVVVRAAPEEEVVAPAEPEEVVVREVPEEVKEKIIARVSPEEEVVARAESEEKGKEEVVVRVAPEEEVVARAEPEEVVVREVPEEVKEKIIARVAPEEEKVISRAALEEEEVVARGVPEGSAARTAAEEEVKEELVARTAPDEEKVVAREVPEEEVVARTAPDEETVVARTATDEEKVVARIAPDEEKVVARTAPDEEKVVARLVPEEEVVARTVPEAEMKEDVDARVAPESQAKDEFSRTALEAKGEEEVVARARSPEEANEEVIVRMTREPIETGAEVKEEPATRTLNSAGVETAPIANLTQRSGLAAVDAEFSDLPRTTASSGMVGSSEFTVTSRILNANEGTQLNTHGVPKSLDNSPTESVAPRILSGIISEAETIEDESEGPYSRTLNKPFKSETFINKLVDNSRNETVSVEERTFNKTSDASKNFTNISQDIESTTPLESARNHTETVVARLLDYSPSELSTKDKEYSGTEEVAVRSQNLSGASTFETSQEKSSDEAIKAESGADIRSMDLEVKDKEVEALTAIFETVTARMLDESVARVAAILGKSKKISELVENADTAETQMLETSRSEHNSPSAKIGNVDSESSSRIMYGAESEKEPLGSEDSSFSKGISPEIVPRELDGTYTNTSSNVKGNETVMTRTLVSSNIDSNLKQTTLETSNRNVGNVVPLIIDRIQEIVHQNETSSVAENPTFRMKEDQISTAKIEDSAAQMQEVPKPEVRAMDNTETLISTSVHASENAEISKTATSILDSRSLTSKSNANETAQAAAHATASTAAAEVGSASVTHSALNVSEDQYVQDRTLGESLEKDRAVPPDSTVVRQMNLSERETIRSGGTENQDAKASEKSLVSSSAIEATQVITDNTKDVSERSLSENQGQINVAPASTITEESKIEIDGHRMYSNATKNNTQFPNEPEDLVVRLLKPNSRESIKNLDTDNLDAESRNRNLESSQAGSEAATKISSVADTVQRNFDHNTTTSANNDSVAERSSVDSTAEAACNPDTSEKDELEATGLQQSTSRRYDASTVKPNTTRRANTRRRKPGRGTTKPERRSSVVKVDVNVNEPGKDGKMSAAVRGDTRPKKRHHHHHHHHRSTSNSRSSGQKRNRSRSRKTPRSRNAPRSRKTERALPNAQRSTALPGIERVMPVVGGVSDFTGAPAVYGAPGMAVSAYPYGAAFVPGMPYPYGPTGPMMYANMQPYGDYYLR